MRKSRGIVDLNADVDPKGDVHSNVDFALWADKASLSDGDPWVNEYWDRSDMDSSLDTDGIGIDSLIRRAFEDKKIEVQKKLQSQNVETQDSKGIKNDFLIGRAFEDQKVEYEKKIQRQNVETQELRKQRPSEQSWPLFASSLNNEQLDQMIMCYLNPSNQTR